VHLKRVFGHQEAPRFDPFLLLDDFHSDNPADYLAGFPWHPHRGIETVTYMLHGEVEHGDSIGNQGVISPGDLQWMTAGGGIIHQEMPKQVGSGLLWGFQLWVNLPAADKMMPPRYRGITSPEIPTIDLGGGASAKVIAGKIGDTSGPVRDLVVEVEYLDVSLAAAGVLTRNIKRGYTVLAYMLEGSCDFDTGQAIVGERLAVLNGADSVKASAGPDGARFLLLSGQPIGEPVAWHGPIVMNTQEELQVAFDEYEQGTFLK